MATAKKSGTTSKAAAKKKAPAKKKATAKTAAKKKAPAKKKATAKTAAKKKAPAKKKATAKTAAKTTTKKKAPAKKKATAKTAAKTTTKKKAPAKKARKSPFGKKFVNEMKGRLLDERAKYLHSAEEYRAEADALIEGREPGDVQFDEESGEGDTLAVERERDLALSAQARAAVEQIDAALERIENNTYGLCVTSGLPIPQDRLRAIPWAAERVEYKVGGLGRL